MSSAERACMTCIIFTYLIGQSVGFFPKQMYANYLAPGSSTHETITQQAVDQSARDWFRRNAPTYCDGGALANGYDLSDTGDVVNFFKACYGRSQSNKMYKEALSNIIESNTDTDSPLHTEANDPTYHFDAEHILDTNLRMMTARAPFIASLKGGDYQGAQQQLGPLLHTLQDFYSHTNWLEAIAKDINKNVGLQSNLGYMVADKSVATCANCTLVMTAKEAWQALSAQIPINGPISVAVWTYLKVKHFSNVYDCTTVENLQQTVYMHSLLTSGYYGGQSIDGVPVPKPADVGKCSHGGILDSTSDQSAVGGINKDSASRYFSPHYNLHTEAADLAEQATEYYLDSVRDAVGEDAYGRFLNLIYRSKTSLAIVIDTTGSMDPYIEAAKQTSYNIIDSNMDEHDRPDKYILVPFNDPYYGPVLVTEDPDEFKNAISSLKADGGGDCPEMCLHGILLAEQAASPNTPIFVFTDADAKDKDLEDQVVSLSNQNDLKISFVLGGTGCPGMSSANSVGNSNRAADKKIQRQSVGDFNTNPLYYRVAEKSGGLVLATSEDLNSILNTSGIIEDAISTQRVQIFSQSDMTTSQSVAFWIDPSMTSLSVVLTAAYTTKGFLNLTLLTPSGQPMNTSTHIDTPSTKMYRISLDQNDPSQYGNWTAEITVSSVSSYGINVYGESDFSITYNLLATDDGFTDVTGNPLSNSNAILVLSNIGATGVTISEVDFVNDVNAIIHHDICIPIAGTATCALNFTVPAAPFHIRAYGSDKGGNRIQRVADSPVTPTMVSLQASLINANTTVLPGDKRTIQFNVTNLGLRNSFEFSVTDSQNFAQKITPTQATLDTNESVQGTIQVLVPSTIAPGTTSYVQVAAGETSGADSNFLQVLIVVSDPNADLTPPNCMILSNSINTTCKAASARTCDDYTWQASMVFWDHGSGLLRTTESSSNGSALWIISSYANGTADHNVSAIVNGSCCIENFTLTVVDETGWVSQCFAQRLPYVSPTNSTPTSGGISKGVIAAIVIVVLFVVVAAVFSVYCVKNPSTRNSILQKMKPQRHA